MRNCLTNCSNPRCFLNATTPPTTIATNTNSMITTACSQIRKKSYFNCVFRTQINYEPSRAVRIAARLFRARHANRFERGVVRRTAIARDLAVSARLEPKRRALVWFSVRLLFNAADQWTHAVHQFLQIRLKSLREQRGAIDQTQSYKTRIAFIVVCCTFARHTSHRLHLDSGVALASNDLAMIDRVRAEMTVTSGRHLHNSNNINNNITIM